MAEEKLSIILESFFSDKGFKKANASLKTITNSANNLNKIFSGINLTKKVNIDTSKLKAAGVEVKTFQKTITNDLGEKIKVPTLQYRIKDKGEKNFAMGEERVIQHMAVIEAKQKKINDLKQREIDINKAIEKGNKRKTDALQKSLDQQQPTMKTMPEMDKAKTVGAGLGDMSKVDLLKQRFKAVGIEYDKLNKKTLRPAMAKVTAYEKVVSTKATAMKKSMFSFSRAMGALSVLFLSQQIGMAMQRMATISMQSFMKISQGQTEAGMAMTALSANMEYLKFVFGNTIATALLPFIPAIMEIIQNVANFIAAHPKLVGMGFAFGFIFVKAALVGAQLILLLAGIQNLTGVAIGTALSTLSTKFETLSKKIGLAVKAFAFTPQGAVLLVIAAILAFLIWNLGQFPEETKKVKESFNGLGSTIKSVLSNIGNSFVNIFTDANVSSEVWAMGFAAAVTLIVDALGVVLNIIGVVIVGVIDTVGLAINAVASGVKALYALVDGDDATTFSNTWTEAFDGLKNYDMTFDQAGNLRDSMANAVNNYRDNTNPELLFPQDEIVPTIPSISGDTSIPLPQTVSTTIPIKSPFEESYALPFSNETISGVDTKINNINDGFIDMEEILSGSYKDTMDEQIVTQAALIDELSGINGEMQGQIDLTESSISEAVRRITSNEDEGKSLIFQAQAQERLNRAIKGATSGSSGSYEDYVDANAGV